MVKPTYSWAFDERTVQANDTTNNVDHTRSTDPAKSITFDPEKSYRNLWRSPIRRLTRTNEKRLESGVNKVSDELGSFSNGSGCDSGGGDGEGPLVQEIAVNRPPAAASRTLVSMMFLVFLGTDGAETEHCETKLHGEDELGGEKKISGVNGVCGVVELGGDGVELVADESGGTGDVSGVGAEHGS
ncbi:hypothetical protein L6452_05082 [Arctium lappa]|uniref:Uncharacterized protein n=1 Tax=Arctium lappa TaxID=4217 RepID=A0ACB9EGH0_ARCLA|nr:hypothetical protein L6452_05082 [Arctium lappa]